MDLSKACDWLIHHLIIDQFEAYDLSKSSLSLLLDYLTACKERVEISSSNNLRNEIKKSVPQGATLAPLLFNVVNVISCLLGNLKACNFADDKTIYDCDEDLSNILENLKHDTRILLEWFKINSLQASSGKFEFRIIGIKKRTSIKLIINLTEIEENRKVVLLGITLNNLLTLFNI